MRDLPAGFRIAIYGIIILIIILIYYFASYSPKVKVIKNKQGQYNQLYNEIINLSPKVTDDKYVVALEELELAKAQWEKLKNYLSEEMGNTNILYDELSNLSQIQGVNLKIYNRGNTGLSRIDNFQSRVSFEVNLDGQFMNVLSFLYSLNTLQNIINADAFTIKPASKGTEGYVNILFGGTFSAFKFNVNMTKE